MQKKKTYIINFMNSDNYMYMCVYQLVLCYKLYTYIFLYGIILINIDNTYYII